jgi:sugar lactone lactonase YvrE
MTRKANNFGRIAKLSATMLAMLANAAPSIAAQATFNNPSGVDVKGGAVYVADYSAIRKIVGGNVTTIAGSCAQGYANGTGTAAKFNYVSAIAVGASGNIYVTEHTNNTVRKITPAGVVTTIAGLGPTSSLPMTPSIDGLPATATFNHPTGIAVNAAETFLFVADSYDYSIRRIKISNGMVKTIVAGRNMNIPGQNGIGNPTGLALRAGNLYIAEQAYGRIRVVDLSLYSGTPLQASTLPTLAPATFSMNHPAGIALDSSNNVYVSEGNGSGPGQGNLIKKGPLSGFSLTTTIVAGAANTSGATNGAGSAARFNTPAGISLNGAGTMLFVADQRNHKIRRMQTVFPYTVSTFAGNTPGSGCADGTAL